MSIFENLRPHRIQHSLVVFCLLSVLPPLSAQTAKELMIDACYNERKQHKNDALWASRVERHTAGHIYLEEEIETVGGPIHRLILVDGHEPSPSERKQDDDRLGKLLQNPKAQQAMKKNREADQKNVDEILRAVPDALLFEDQGRQEGLEKLAFRPNPAYNPTPYEERALPALSGVILIDLQEKRLAQFSATLTEQVDFGYGVLGQLKKGGTIEVKRIRLSPGIWKTNSSKISVYGASFSSRPLASSRTKLKAASSR
ncbi:hypothetical protein BDD14_5294 [Edaphobacter modestus]|uniref:Uncharacterized protein n=2 Tax=Edaphobacter modestus TaxID=388466 RepID=A0A4Q7Z242_9BACT|nr:hypothetical protein BDD14_5294 [Edaphobacter modestus]